VCRLRLWSSMSGVGSSKGDIGGRLDHVSCPSKTDIQQPPWHVRLVPPQSVAGSFGGREFVPGTRDAPMPAYLQFRNPA
jgi:hypothetical protein